MDLISSRGPKVCTGLYITQQDLNLVAVINVAHTEGPNPHNRYAEHSRPRSQMYE